MVYEQLRACVPPGSHELLQALENLHEKEYESETSDVGLRDLRDDLERVMSAESVREWLVKATDECSFEELTRFSDFGHLVTVFDQILDGSVTPRDLAPCSNGSHVNGSSRLHRFSYEDEKYAINGLGKEHGRYSPGHYERVCTRCNLQKLLCTKHFSAPS